MRGDYQERSNNIFSLKQTKTFPPSARILGYHIIWTLLDKSGIKGGIHSPRMRLRGGRWLKVQHMLRVLRNSLLSRSCLIQELLRASPRSAFPRLHASPWVWSERTWRREKPAAEQRGWTTSERWKHKPHGPPRCCIWSTILAESEKVVDNCLQIAVREDHNSNFSVRNG